MPLNKSCSVEAFQENIRTEIIAGRKPEQAAAIARSTLEDACKREHKPIPKSVEKKTSSKRSREYLEAALAQAKKLLPGWMFAVIHQAAFPSSGGRAAANRRLSAMEKAWLEKSYSGMSNKELSSMMYKLNTTLAAYKRQGKDIATVLSRAKGVADEMRKRGMKPKGDASKKQKTEKGFLSGEPDGGAHAHGLDRANKKTFNDGAHIHLWLIPGTGEVISSIEDGAHAHRLKTDNTEEDGAHSHQVMLSDGRLLETELGGEHDHTLMVETSCFNGLHRHRLRLPDGTMVNSMTPAEYAKLYGQQRAWPLYSARQISDALNEIQRMWMETQEHGECCDVPSVENVLYKFAKTGELPKFPTVSWEVQSVMKNGANCTLGDMEVEKFILNSKNLEIAPGDIVNVDHEGVITGFSKETEPDSFDDALALETYVDEIRKATDHIDFAGPSDAKLLFVAASPSSMELARKEMLVGPDGALFQESYLAPMGLKKSDVGLGFAVPVLCENPTETDIELWRDRLVKAVSRFTRAKVVALGRVAKEALGPLATVSVPHPAAIRRHGDKGEVARKVKSIAKALDLKSLSVETGDSSIGTPIQGKPGTTLADLLSELRKDEGLRIPVTKAMPEKQIVYGVILDPYQVDLHNDWIPPAEIESTAHDFLEKSRVIGLRHNGPAEATVVESWVEIYPSAKDRELALSNMPHKVFRRQFGDDVVHSGAWIAGVKLSDDLWALYKKGDLDAFSIGGFSFKTKVNLKAMPEVEFIDLEPRS